MQDFTIVRKGFDTTEVDSYIVGLESEIEKRDQKIQEYRSKEDAINRAVIDAQLIADAIVAKAREEASTIKSEASAELEALRTEALSLRKNLTEFQESYNRLLRRYLFTAHCTDMNQLFGRLDTLLKNIDVDPESLSPLPPVQEQPQEDIAPIHMSNAASDAAPSDEWEPVKNLDEIRFNDTMKSEGLH